MASALKRARTRERLVDAATTLAAALIVQRGRLSELELRSLPLIGRSESVADAVLHRLVTRYGVRITERGGSARSARSIVLSYSKHP